MSNVIIPEKSYRKLLYAWYEMNALEAGGVDNWGWYGECFSQDLTCWNNDHIEEQYEDWEDLTEACVEDDVSGTPKGVYILLEDGTVKGVYSSYDKAHEVMATAIDKIDSVKVDWANEDCGFTTVYTTFGDTIEFEISDELEVM